MVTQKKIQLKKNSAEKERERERGIPSRHCVLFALYSIFPQSKKYFKNAVRSTVCESRIYYFSWCFGTCRAVRWVAILKGRLDDHSHLMSKLNWLSLGLFKGGLCVCMKGQGPPPFDIKGVAPPFLSSLFRYDGVALALPIPLLSLSHFFAILRCILSPCHAIRFF